MGWKGNLRKISSVSNQISRESEKQFKRQEREQARQAKNEMQINSALEKPIKELKKLLASGKIDTEKYSKLLDRQKDIERELFVFPDIRTAMANLGARYLTGKIDKQEFDILRDQILGDLAEDRKEFLKAEEKLSNLLPNLNKDLNENKCISCGKLGKLFCPLKSMTIGTNYKKITLNICNDCAKNLKTKLE